MTSWEQNWADDVLAAFAPESGEGLAPLAGEVDYRRTLRRMASGATPLAAFGLRVALWMVVFAPFWLLGRFATFSTLAMRERTELLQRLLRHTSHLVRELSLLLKLTAAMALLGTPSVRARSGYDAAQPSVAQVAIERSRRHLPLAGSLEQVPPDATRDAITVVANSPLMAAGGPAPTAERSAEAPRAVES